MIGNGRDNLAWEIQTSVQGEEHDSSFNITYGLFY